MIYFKNTINLFIIYRYDNLSLEKAYEHLLDRRPIAAPNYGFLIQLIRYEKELRDKDQKKENDNQQNPVKPVKDSSDTTVSFWKN